MLPSVSWGLKKGRFPFQEVPVPSQGDSHVTGISPTARPL